MKWKIFQNHIRGKVVTASDREFIAIRNGGMIIDLSELAASSIDKANQRAVIQPVISNRELARCLGEYDLAFPIGHLSKAIMTSTYCK